MKDICTFTVAVWLLAFFAVPPLQAQPLTEETEAEAYIHEFTIEKENFEETLNNQVKPRLNEIRETFRNSLSELESHLYALHRNPQDEERKQQYEEALSKTLVNASDVLRSFAEVGPQAIQAFDEFDRKMVTATETLRQTAEQAEEDQQYYTAQHAKVEDVLRKLAESKRGILAANEEFRLDPQLALQVKLLHSDLKFAKQHAMFCEIEARDAAWLIADLKQQRQLLEGLKHSLVVGIHEADGTTLILGKIGDIKAKRLSYQQLTSRLEVFSKAIPNLGNDLQDMEKLFSMFVNHDPSLNRTPHRPASSESTAPGESALDILKAYLPTNAKGTKKS